MWRLHSSAAPGGETRARANGHPLLKTMKPRKMTRRMTVLVLASLSFIEWFGRCALCQAFPRLETVASADKNFTAEEHLLSLLWKYSQPKNQWRHLTQQMENAGSQPVKSEFSLEHSNTSSILSPKAKKSDILFNDEPDHDFPSFLPLSLQSSPELTVGSNVPMFSPTHIPSASSSFPGSLFSSSMSHSLKRQSGRKQSPYSHGKAAFPSLRSPDASKPSSPLPGSGQLLETSPLASPAPSNAHSPCARLYELSPSSKLHLPSIFPPFPILHQPTRSKGLPGQHFHPPASFVPKLPQEKHGQMPSSSPASAPTATSADAPKSTGEPFSHWRGHKHIKSPPDCATVLCSAPYTQTPLGSPCGCVLPIKVGLELSVVLYALFPSISVLAEEIANGTLLLRNQVRITGANADSEDQGKSIAEVNLVPLDQAFDKLTAILIYKKFWNHEVPISEKVFGPYSVMYVRYPGLPPSPPSAYPQVTTMGELPTESGPVEQPLSVNVDEKAEKMDSTTIAMIALSSTIASAVGLVVLWALFLKCIHSKAPLTTNKVPTKTCVSKGPGGFGRVYFGNLEDGRKVAVKVLTRKDQQGIREFNAEVNTLSRLHHRNLVKLIGICREEHNHCLVYELISNGSVESHLHGIDKLSAPLDWEARMKIALGAARGLAYLHEDSNPCIIHRDFKASNILLENDFSPKISDFGLATAAPDEGNHHISMRVMGTFGYVAPEYAMTGHLLVKSDVYSYGVVLLELLSGRKPVDVSQPPGQENLVTWARPLLSSREGLEMLVDPALKDKVPLDSLTKMAAIASMCVQPEVSQRPFMGEVVQALKLVCKDLDASNGVISVTVSPQNSGDRNDNLWVRHGNLQTVDSMSFLSVDYDSGSIRESDYEPERLFSISTLPSNSDYSFRDLSNSIRRYSSSDPLTSSGTTSWWKRDEHSIDGSMSEHALRRLSNIRFNTESYISRQ